MICYKCLYFVHVTDIHWATCDKEDEFQLLINCLHGVCSVNPYTASGYFTYIINVTNLSKPSNVQPTCCKLSNSSKPQISNWLSVKSRQRVQINRHQIDKFPFLNAYKLLLRKSQIQLCRAVQRPRSKFPQALKPSALHCKAWDRGCQFPDVASGNHEQWTV